MTNVPTASTYWAPKTITISISGTTVKATLTMDAITIDSMKLSDSDVELAPATYVDGTSEYRVPITLKGTNPPPIETLADQTFTASKTGVSVELVKGEDGKPALNADGKYELKLTGVSAAKDWEVQYITIAVSGIKVTSGALAALQAIKIDAISAADIDIKLLTGEDDTETDLKWENVTTYGDGRTKTFKIRVKTPGDKEISKLDVTNNTTNVTLNWTSGNEATITAYPNWTETKVSFIINADENGENGITKTEFFTIPAITGDDFGIEIPAWDSVTANEDGSKSLPLTITVPASVSTINTLQAVGGDIQLHEGNPILIISPVWETITSIKFTIKDVEKVVDYTIPAKTISATDVTVSLGTGSGENVSNNTNTQCFVKISFKEGVTGVTISEVTPIDGTKVTVSKENWDGEGYLVKPDTTVEGNENGVIPDGEVLLVKTSHGNFKITLFSSGTAAGSVSLNNRSLAGRLTNFVKDLVYGSSEAYTEKNVSAYSYSDPVIVIDESVSVLARDIADVLAEQETLAKKEAKKAAKAAKKAKKAQKAAAAKIEKAPVEKPVVTETVETVAVTSAAAVSEVVETVTETVANEGTVATVEEAAPEAKVSMTAVDASVTESVADDQTQSDAILWLALAALCAAVVGIVVLFLKNRAAKK